MHIFRLNRPSLRPCGLDALLQGRKTVIALGNFDGVHLAHREILMSAIEAAQAQGSISAVFTFEQSKKPYITSFEERMALFEEIGIELVFVADFDGFKGQAAEDFAVDTLIGALSAAGVSCGFNFRFGHMASGDVALLRAISCREGIECRVSPPIEQEGIPVSSTEIRRQVSVGNLENARSMLGRAYSLSGIVLHGRAVGRQMNFPTMNLSLEEGRLLPPYGVYFTLCHVDGVAYPAITNIGIRPTFGLTEISCESHLLSASGNFYDKPLKVELLHFHRPEQKFDSRAALTAAIADDTEAARRYFGLK